MRWLRCTDASVRNTGDTLCLTLSIVLLSRACHKKAVCGVCVGGRGLSAFRHSGLSPQYASSAGAFVVILQKTGNLLCCNFLSGVG